MPFLTFSDVERYAEKVSSRSGIQKAYKFLAEPGYLFDYQGMLTAEVEALYNFGLSN